MPCCKVLIDQALMSHYQQFTEEPPKSVTINKSDLDGELLEVVDLSSVWGHKCTLYEETIEGKVSYKVEDV